jgi:hypothetical protein
MEPALRGDESGPIRECFDFIERLLEGDDQYVIDAYNDYVIDWFYSPKHRPYVGWFAGPLMRQRYPQFFGGT